MTDSPFDKAPYGFHLENVIPVPRPPTMFAPKITLYTHIFVGYGDVARVNGGSAVLDLVGSQGNEIYVQPILGLIRKSTAVPGNLLISVSGTYNARVAPGDLIFTAQPFSALLELEPDWSGRATLSYGVSILSDLVVTPMPVPPAMA